MPNQDFFQKLEEKSDYSIALVEEINTLVAGLPNCPRQNVESQLAKISQKIALAKTKSIHVEKLEQQIIEFRTISLLDTIKSLIQRLNNWNGELSIDISHIQSEYEYLSQLNTWDKQNITDKYNTLKIEIKKSNLLFQLNDIINSNGISQYSLENIQTQYMELKSQNIDMPKIETLLFDM